MTMVTEAFRSVCRAKLNSFYAHFDLLHKMPALEFLLTSGGPAAVSTHSGCEINPAESKWEQTSSA